MWCNGNRTAWPTIATRNHQLRFAQRNLNRAANLLPRPVVTPLHQMPRKDGVIRVRHVDKFLFIAGALVLFCGAGGRNRSENLDLNQKNLIN
jgi:hypothetical protein